MSGIMSLLDEEIKIPKGSDDSWLEKLSRQHDNNSLFFKPKKSRGVFGIKHYAGDVCFIFKYNFCLICRLFHR